MAPEPLRGRWTPLAFIVAALFCAAPAHALRLIDWNILNYPGTSGPTRDPGYRTVLAPLNADVLITEEMTSQAGVNEYLASLNTMEPGQWAAAPFLDGNDTDSGLFYKPARVQFLGQWGFYPNAANQLRLVHVYRMIPVGYSAEAAEFRVYALHLKASKGFETQRAQEATGLRDSMNAMPPGTHAFAVGDCNFYTGLEPAMVKMLENQLNNTGRLYDPLGLQNVTWQDNTTMLIADTQSPCASTPGCAPGAATGGMDDRFDLILPTTNFADGSGYELVPGSYVSVGNDGLHHNLNLTDAPVIPEGAAYAAALRSISDHLPVRVDLILPPRAGVPAALAFGTVITGATASQVLAITNTAAPLDSLNLLHYALAPSAGFTAPVGGFSLLEGASSSDAIGMDTSTPGVKTGTISVSTDDPDHTLAAVSLSGTVLRHAAASLDSTTAVTNAVADFGTHDADTFADALVRVHDLGWDALQARLHVTAGAISGGAGHFSIIGGFADALLAGVGRTYSVAFDPTGATPDSLYEATLTLSSADETLPGALAQGDLTVALKATLQGSGNVSVDAGKPGATVLFAPSPNPMVASGALRFDLAQGGPVTLEIFDLGGRRIATPLRRALEAGHYSVKWSGQRDDGARLGAGLYFVRLTAPGVAAQTTRLAVIR